MEVWGFGFNVIKRMGPHLRGKRVLEGPFWRAAASTLVSEESGGSSCFAVWPLGGPSTRGGLCPPG